MPKKIVYTIDEDGTVTVDAQGFADGECLEATHAVEAAIGQVASRKLKNPAGPVTIRPKQQVKG
jgi:hypothetical protein